MITEFMSVRDLESLLTRLKPIEEKTIRLLYGIGCTRSHTVPELATALEASASSIRAIRKRAWRRLSNTGVTPKLLRDLNEHITSSRQANPTRLVIDPTTEIFQATLNFTQILKGLLRNPGDLFSLEPRRFEEIICEI